MAGRAGAAGGDEIQRWTSGRKAAVVLDVIKGKATPADLARQHDLTVAEIEGWVEKFLEGGKEGLRAVPRELEARFDAERRDLLAKVGELTLQVDALKKKTSSAASLAAASGQAQSL
jgi:transposase-like protein